MKVYVYIEGSVTSSLLFVPLLRKLALDYTTKELVPLGESFLLSKKICFSSNL